MKPEPYIFNKLIPKLTLGIINDVDEEGCSEFHRQDSSHSGQTCSRVKYPKQLLRGGLESTQQKLRETSRALVNLGADLNNQLTKPTKYRSRRTPLFLAVEANEFDTVAELFQARTNVNLRNEEGKNALFFQYYDHSSYQNEQALKIFKLLCLYGTDINCATKLGGTPIMRHVYFGITDLLLDMGVNIEQRILDGGMFTSMNPWDSWFCVQTGIKSRWQESFLIYQSPLQKEQPH